MERLRTNTAYQVKAYSDKGGICFTATRRYCSATYNGITQYGFLGWEVETQKVVDGKWTRVTFKGYPERIGNKKAVIDFLAGKEIFSQACSELKK